MNVAADLQRPPVGPELFSLREHTAAQLFPVMGDPEIRSLAADIKANGLRNPVVLMREGSDYVVLDGRNRILACRMLDLFPRWSEWDGADPVAFVLSENLHRRHLSESQRAMVAAKLATLRRGQRADRVDGSIGLSTAAQKLNVGVESVKRARVVRQSGDTRLIEAVEADRISVSAAAVMATLSQQERAEAVERLMTGDHLVRSKCPDDVHKRRTVVLDLHRRGMGTAEIAAETGLPKTTVSTMKTKLGVSASAPAAKLWLDIERAATALEGASIQVDKLTEMLLGGAELNVDQKEMATCIKRLSRATGCIRALASVLRARIK